MRASILLILVFMSTMSFATDVEKKRTFFRKEFACYSKIVHNSHFPPKDVKPKYYFSHITVDAEKLLSIEQRLGDGKVARVYFFTEDGAFSYTMNQTEQFKSYFFQIHTDGKNRILAFDRSQFETLGTNSSAFVYDDPQNHKQIKLPIEVDDKTREVLYEALSQRIQSMKSTFDWRVNSRQVTLKSFGNRSISMEEAKNVISVQNSQDYINQLMECREALGSDKKFEKLTDLINKELLKFTTRSESTNSIPTKASH